MKHPTSMEMSARNVKTTVRHFSSNLPIILISSLYQRKVSKHWTNYQGCNFSLSYRPNIPLLVFTSHSFDFGTALERHRDFSQFVVGDVGRFFHGSADCRDTERDGGRSSGTSDALTAMAKTVSPSIADLEVSA